MKFVNRFLDTWMTSSIIKSKAALAVGFGNTMYKVSNNINDMKGIQPKRENLYNIFISSSTNNDWPATNNCTLLIDIETYHWCQFSTFFFFSLFTVDGAYIPEDYEWVLLKIFWINRTNPVPSVTEKNNKKMPN